MNVELFRCIDRLKPGENPPFVLIDIREPSESDLMDLPKYNKVRLTDLNQLFDNTK